MRTLVLRLCLFALPFAAAAAIEPLLPLNALTFRCWETLRIYHRLSDALGAAGMTPWTALPGPFLPSTRVSRVEVGDLGHHTEFAVPRRVSWVTDEHGFRASPHGAAELVIVGDSHVVGSGLSQNDTMAEVLSRDHGITAYPYAPASIGQFLGDRRFKADAPTHLVLECAEWNLITEFSAAVEVRRAPERVRDGRLRAVEFAFARVLRHNMLSFLRARVRERPSPIAYGGMLFFQGAPANEEVGRHAIEEVARTLSFWERRVSGRGIRFAVMIVPNKDNTYADLIPGARRASLIASLAVELRSRGVTLIDLEGDLVASRSAGERPFQVDDSHVSAAGACVLSRRVAGWVRDRGR